MPAVHVIEGLAYGPDPSQVGDLHLPDRERPPVVCLLHGGFWRMPFGRDQLTPLAADLTRRGFAAWNLEYRRLGGGGGWPATLLDVAAGIDHLASLAGDGIDLDLDRVAAVGHSAGGQLALWAAARPRLAAGLPGADPRVRVRAAAGQAAVVDLVRAQALGLSRGVAAELLGGPPEEVPERYAAASPRSLLPLGVPQLLVHGDADDTVPVEMARDYVAAAGTCGDLVEYVEGPGVGHFEHLDARGAAWAAVATWLGKVL